MQRIDEPHDNHAGAGWERFDRVGTSQFFRIEEEAEGRLVPAEGFLVVRKLDLEAANRQHRECLRAQLLDTEDEVIVTPAGMRFSKCVARVDDQTGDAHPVPCCLRDGHGPEPTMCCRAEGESGTRLWITMFHTPPCGSTEGWYPHHEAVNVIRIEPDDAGPVPVGDEVANGDAAAQRSRAEPSTLGG